MRGSLKILIMKKKDPSSINKCRKKNQTEFNSYYQTVIMSVGLKHIFNNEEPCVFKINEPSMHHSTNTVTPDAIFQCDDDKKGIVCEIKTSLPTNEEYLLNDMKDLIEKYSNIKKGWKTNDGQIDDHSILLLLHRWDSREFKSLLSEWLDSKTIVTDKNICIAEWQSVRPLKMDSKDMILLNHHYGTTGCDYFDQKLKEDIKLDIDAISIEYETRKFVKAAPPDLYIMTMLYQDIFPTFANDEDEFTITIGQLMKTLTDYYTSWSGLEGEQTQIRKNWIIRAMDKFAEIKVVEKIPGESYSYRIKWSKNLPKNIKEYLLRKLCGKEQTVINDPKQTKLDM